MARKWHDARRIAAVLAQVGRVAHRRALRSDHQAGLEEALTGISLRAVQTATIREPCTNGGVGLASSPGKLADVTSASPALDAVVDEPLAHPVRTDEVSTRAPAAPGLYAWWAPPTVLPELTGPAHPASQDLRLLYVGLAMKLRSRLASNHLRRSGSSTLRRTLAGLLLDEQGYRTQWTDRVVLVEEDEARLTMWMSSKLRVSWCEHSTPRDVEADVIRALHPPLNVDHASDSALQVIKTARRRYYDSAGPRPISPPLAP